MRHIDLDIRPMAWASHVKIDGEEMPCSRVSVVSDLEPAGRHETRVELSYCPVDASGSDHQPAIHVAGCLLDAEEYGRVQAMRALLERMHTAATTRLYASAEHSPSSEELAIVVLDIEAVLGWGK